MVRGACKNYHDVAIVTDVSQYAAVIEEMKANDGSLGLPTRERLAGAAFALHPNGSKTLLDTDLTSTRGIWSVEAQLAMGDNIEFGLSKKRIHRHGHRPICKGASLIPVD